MAKFINHTPFDALCYAGYDVKQQEYDVVVCCAEYFLHKIDKNIETHILSKDNHIIEQFYGCAVNDVEPIPLTLTDEFYGETLLTSVLNESDLSPYKPKCDIIIQGYAYHKSPTLHFDASFSLYRLDDNNQLKKLAHKGISIFGECDWTLNKDVGSISLNNFTYFYKPTQPKTLSKISLRYEYALGGQNLITHQGDTVYNEVCYKNPIGIGWLCFDYFDKLKQYEQPIPNRIAMPQILSRGASLIEPSITKQSGSMTAKEMAQLAYPNAATGFGFVHRSWSPRIAKAGTYDEHWLNNIHPFYPEDFDFNYYNGAPEDQQIDFPDLQIPHYLLINNLSPNAGLEAIILPRHRAFVLISMLGIRVPIPMQVDTIVFDNNKMSLKIVWRTAMLKSFESSEIQLRFEVDPESPLIKFQGESDES
ncbi:hypothetical protein SAMN02745664_11657 [Moraxella cuniculi DSM 21768]|uniref:DUF2169 domain-containing protein n=1 Tax=Moraxella cuniculi DSM 21768 TaxID=1122245 RepID=A0A1N7FSI8_9GAMM|nr:DUF2169 domain-containing protein [Moraxella cuniculi]OOS08340.1 hypothetical protein B0189_00010 [Moraxella cuniculi]SIS03308.1 hypothetical protein SAMN02745664_11657 [Moraxella cuniculi DSM 21768]